MSGAARDRTWSCGTWFPHGDRRGESMTPPFNFVGPTAPGVNQQLAHAPPRPVSVLQEHRRILSDSGLTGRPLPDA
jgi:hypothetical protein